MDPASWLAFMLADQSSARAPPRRRRPRPQHRQPPAPHPPPRPRPRPQQRHVSPGHTHTASQARGRTAFAVVRSALPVGARDGRSIFGAGLAVANGREDVLDRRPRRSASRRRNAQGRSTRETRAWPRQPRSSRRQSSRTPLSLPRVRAAAARRMRSKRLPSAACRRQPPAPHHPPRRRHPRQQRQPPAPHPPRH